MHIGKRKLKSVLAVFVAFWLWQLVRIPFPDLEMHPVFVYIYGIIEIRDTSSKTVDFGKKRIKSTVIALSLGLPILAVSKYLQSHVSEGYLGIAIELGMLLFGVLLTLIVAEKAGCDSFTGLAATVFAVLFASGANTDPYIYAVLRAFQTIVGVFIAWLINVQLFPYHGKSLASNADENVETSKQDDSQKTIR